MNTRIAHKVRPSHQLSSWVMNGRSPTAAPRYHRTPKWYGQSEEEYIPRSGPIHPSIISSAPSSRGHLPSN